MEVGDWKKRQLASYISDGERILQRLAASEVDGFVLDCALGLLTTYLTIPRQIATDPRLDEVLAKVARALFEDIWLRGYWNQIAVWWPKLISIIQSLPDPDLKMRLSVQLSVIKCNRGEIKEGLALSEPLLTSPDFALVSPFELAGTLHHVGAWYIHLGEYFKAIELLNQCFELANRNNFWDLKAYALNLLGNIALFQGDFKRAHHYYQKSLAILRENSGDNDQACIAYQSLGRLFIIQKQLQEAIPLIEKGLAIRRHWGDREGIANNAVYLAQAYLGCNQVVEAESLLDEALSIYKSLHFPSGIILCYSAFGQLETKRGCYPQAMAHYRQALEIIRDNPTPPLELQILCKLLPLLLRAGQVRELVLTLVRLVNSCREQRLSLAGAWRLVTSHIR